MDHSDTVTRFRTLAHAIREEQYKSSVELSPGKRIQH